MTGQNTPRITLSQPLNTYGNMFPWFKRDSLESNKISFEYFIFSKLTINQFCFFMAFSIKLYFITAQTQNESLG